MAFYYLCTFISELLNILLSTIITVQMSIYAVYSLQLELRCRCHAVYSVPILTAALINYGIDVMQYFVQFVVPFTTLLIIVIFFR